MASLNVRFSQGSSFQLEGTTATIAVVRDDSSGYSGAFSVGYLCSGLNATPHQDFEVVSGTLNSNEVPNEAN